MNSLDLAFDSIRNGFEAKNPLGIVALSVAIVFFVIMLSLLSLYEFRYFLKGRFIYYRRKLRGEAVSNDRIRRNLPIVLSLPHDPMPFRTRIRNISNHGMYVEMDPPMMPGDYFRFILTINDQKSISGSAEVKWQLITPTPLTPRGMGCRFFQLSTEDQNFLRKYLKSSKK